MTAPMTAPLTAPMTLPIVLVLLTGVAFLVALLTQVLPMAPGRRQYAGAVLAWGALLVAANVVRCSGSALGPGRDGVLLTLLAGFVAVQLACLRMVHDAWVELALDAWLIGGSITVLIWAVPLLVGSPQPVTPALADVAHLAVTAWFVAVLLRSLLSRMAPTRLAVAALAGFCLLYLGGSVLLFLVTLGIAVPTGTGPVLVGASFAVLAAATPLIPRLRPDPHLRRSWLWLNLPYLVGLVSAPVALVALLRDGVVRDALYPGLCAACVVALGSRQVLTSTANDRLLEQMAERERRYRSLVQDSSDVIMIASQAGRLDYVSPAARHVLGAPAESMVGRPVSEVLGVSQLALDRAVRKVLDAEGPARLGGWVEIAGSRSYLESLLSIRGDKVLLNVRDVTERAELRERLHEMAYSDSLTGLLNRSRFSTVLSEAISGWRANPAAYCPALLFLDLDDFKRVNDAAGHAVGDTVLRDVAERLRAAVPHRAVLGRIGGDEFVVLLLDRLPGAVDAVAEAIVSAVAAPFKKQHATFVVGASVGIAYAKDAADAGDLLRHADLAMYAAKRQRRSWLSFEPAMHEAAVRRAEGDRLYAAALDQSRVELHYQPLVELDRGQPVGFEALLRWRDASGTLSAPRGLLEYAERTGRMHSLSSWVIGAALDQVQSWRGGVGLVPVAVNLAPVELLRPGLVSLIRDALAARGLPPSSLTIEITEEVLLQQPDRAIRVIGDLRALGARVAIDDFGTGFSSLAYLVDLPVDVLKIDGSFVQALPRNAVARIVVARVVDIARDIGLDVVAEGVETAEQWHLLCGLGDFYAQGTLFAGAVPADEAAAMMARPKGAA